MVVAFGARSTMLDGRMDGDAELPVFELLGAEKIGAVVAGFYRRVPSDPLLGPMYAAHELAAAEERLRDFLIYRLGGPPTYLQKRGHPRLRMRHARFSIDQAARDRWMQLMGESMREQELPESVRAYLARFLGDIATFLINAPA